MRTTIFARILLATLLPLVLVLVLVITTINTIVYSGGSVYAKDMALLAARQLSRQIADKVDASTHLLEVASRGLSRLDYRTPEALERPREDILDILAADPEIYSTWFAYEPDLFPDRQRYYRTLTRIDGQINHRNYFTEEILTNPETSRWYQIPLSTGRPFLNMLDLYDYGLGEGAIHISTVSYPIYSGGRVVGTIGMDFKFEELFNTNSLRLGERQKILIVDESGRILSYNQEIRIDGGQLWDYAFDDRIAMAAALGSGVEYQAEALSPLTGEQAFICLYPVTLEHADRTLYLYLDIPTDELYAAARSSTELIYSTSVMGFLLLIFSVFIATRNIVRPIRELTVNFEKVVGSEQGGASEREILEQTTPTRVVELARLQDSLLQMMSQIRKAHELSLAAAEERVEKERVLAASETQSRFFANMSHEIRTPMNAILGISEILLHDEPLSDKQTKYIGDIQISADSLLTIINDILDLSKLESGRLDLNPVNYDFPKLLANIHTLVQSLADHKHILFTHVEKGDIPRCLFGDDVRLRQVLLNILSNAVKFTREGTVSLTVEVVGDNLVFTVTDSGIGIKPEDLSNLFEPFKQIDTTRNRNIQGTGLGLSISRNLVELMGGVITVDSVYGRGSTFTLIVPKTLGDLAALERKNRTRRVIYSPRLKILVVDDNAINLSVASGLLKTLYGLESDQAASGFEALDKLKTVGYDLIFMDHMMPGMDGVEAVRRIREMGGRNTSLPIVALTANAVRGTCEMLLASGFDGFLTKPIIKEELGAVLFKWVPEAFKRVEEDETEAESEPETAPAAPELTPFLIRAGRISEIDLSAGLASVENETEIYEDMLRLLNDGIPTQSRRLAELAGRGDWIGLSIEVHALKSSLASVGASALSNLARDLEAASGAGDAEFCQEHLPAFRHRFEALGRQLAEALTGTDEPGPAADGSPDGGDLERLVQALAVYDFEVIQGSLKKLLSGDQPPKVAETLAEVKKLLRSFEYDLAAALLAGLKE